MMEQRFSDNETSRTSRRDIPSFIEPRPPLIINPFMRPRPQKGTNLLELFDEDSEIKEPELVQVYLRMKPVDGPNNLYEVRSDKCLVTSLDTTTAGHGRRTQHNVSRMYTFSRIFDAQCSQKEIFEQVVKDNLKKLPDGHSFTLLTYGASGSGKTYTLMGTVNSPGLVPRSLEYVFKMVDASQQPTYKPSESGADKLGYGQQEFELQWVKQLRQVSAPQRDKYRRMSAQLKSDLTLSNFDLTNRKKYYVWVSFVEIYNEAIYDLLAPPDKRTKLRIREDNTGQVYAKGVTQAFVRTGVEAYDVMVAGKHNLVVAATGVHAHSSRSHCIFTITMLTETEGEIRTSCVRLCDLAGCERARATRNTGARMAESRAINSSLHVLERCLHLLRRNQRQRQEALVPYRESKLTRLLGSGLSGSRGEAVSMVVTLNPAPQYAHETKHVLSLAAVAQDIQINNTTAMFASTLESSTHDSTITSTAEVMKLRADNELLHFELIQAQARNKELLAAMKENQEQSATTMKELVEEVKDMTRQYYEEQMQSLRSEMDDMIEEYEARLAKQSAPPISTGTPTRFLQTKVANLMTEITVLEDKLSAEVLARARAEEEVKHLRSCIDERDEKAYKENIPEDQEEVVLTDSEDESDPFNQSLEPIFRMECLNKSKALKLDETKHETEVDSDLEKSSDTIKHNDDTPKNSDYETGDESAVKDQITRDSSFSTNAIEISRNGERVEEHSYTESKISDVNNSDVRGTYFVSDVEQDNGPNDSVEVKDQVRGTYFVKTSASDSSGDNSAKGEENEQESETENDVKQDNGPNDSYEVKDQIRGTYFVRTSAPDTSGDNSANADENEQESETESEKEEYFVRTSAIDTSIDEEMQEIVEHKSMLEEKEIKVPKADTFEDTVKPSKVSETLVSKIIQSLKKSTQSNVSDNSLRQFEQLEQATEDCRDKSSEGNSFGDIKLLKEKRKYFDETDKITEETHVSEKPDEAETVISSNKTKDSFDYCSEKETIPTMHYSTKMSVDDEVTEIKSNENLILKPIGEKRPYFDNTDVNSEVLHSKILTDLKTSCRKNQERSPSIVSDNVDKPFEPSTMKKLLGENIAKLEVLSSIHTNKASVKKQASFDVFESPQVKEKEIITKTPTQISISNVDEVRKSINKLVLEQKSRCDNKQEVIDSAPIEDKPATLLPAEPEIAKNAPILKERVKILVTRPTDTKNDSKQDNTIEEFENIYKDLSTHRPTEFDLLTITNQEIDVNDKNDAKTEAVTENKQGKKEENVQNKLDTKNSESKEVKYNLRHKGKSLLNTSDEKKKDVDDVLLESNATCEKKYNKRSLRLRRRKNEEDSDKDNERLKDIVNLKKEFSDVTLGLPAFKKEIKDIPSPEKRPGDDENLPPLMGIQSCPSKSVTRSRRKLFTPRAEPLEESMSQTGDSNERIHVPRPSYHRARIRRKL